MATCHTSARSNCEHLQAARHAVRVQQPHFCCHIHKCKWLIGRRHEQSVQVSILLTLLIAVDHLSGIPDIKHLRGGMNRNTSIRQSAVHAEMHFGPEVIALSRADMHTVL
jgi:hypothetical protein